MKFKTGLVSLLVVCGACSQATKETDVVKDSFDFAGQQLKYAFTQIDSAKASMPEEQLKRKPVSPRTIEDNGALRLVASRDWTSGFFPGELWYMYEYTQDDFWKKQAQAFTANIEDQKTNGGTHDMGFKMYCSFGNGYRLTNDAEQRLTKALVKESVPGAYIQYTFNLNDKLMLMGGLRGDHSSKYGFFVTPRAHIKYNPNEYVHFRLSAGKGYRTNHVLAENNYLLASSRKVKIADHLNQEEAWNYGASVSTYIPLFGKTLNINAEYYYTDFLKQVVVDMDTAPHEVSFYNLDGRSYSQVLQLEANYPLFKGFTLTAAYRLTDAKTTYNGKLLEKPLTSKYKGLLTASYQTPLGLWQFDATLQLNGGGRMPNPYTLADGSPSWEARYGSFEQLSAQVTRYFRRWSVYVGGENLTNFKQKNPIIDAANPWGENFDSTMIWGPMHGAKAYIGVRFNLPRI